MAADIVNATVCLCLSSKANGCFSSRRGEGFSVEQLGVLAVGERFSFSFSFAFICTFQIYQPTTLAGTAYYGNYYKADAVQYVCECIKKYKWCPAGHSRIECILCVVPVGVTIDLSLSLLV